MNPCSIRRENPGLKKRFPSHPLGLCGEIDFGSLTDMKTIRQEMIRLLEAEARDARELSQILGIKEKEVYAHLDHIARSMKAKKKKLSVRPFSCLSCGFVFQERRRFTRPGRCPKCKDSRVEYPLYRID
jgi:predicted Zn-ribbon and HTH transcriptional regulator